MRNTVSGKNLDDELVTFQSICLVIGEEEYQKFKYEILGKKVIKLFDPIKKVKMKNCNSFTQSCEKPPDIKKKRYS